MASRNTCPAATTHSLFASATNPPRFTASSAGANPAAPTMATMVTSALPPAGSIADDGARRTILSRLVRQHLHIVLGRERFDRKRLGTEMLARVVNDTQR